MFRAVCLLGFPQGEAWEMTFRQIHSYWKNYCEWNNLIKKEGEQDGSEI